MQAHVTGRGWVAPNAEDQQWGMWPLWYNNAGTTGFTTMFTNGADPYDPANWATTGIQYYTGAAGTLADPAINILWWHRIGSLTNTLNDGLWLSFDSVYHGTKGIGGGTFQVHIGSSLYGLSGTQDAAQNVRNQFSPFGSRANVSAGVPLSIRLLRDRIWYCGHGTILRSAPILASSTAAVRDYTGSQASWLDN